MMSASTIAGLCSRYAYLVSQQASVASYCAIAASAYALTACGGFISQRCSKISRCTVASHGVMNEGCQNHAECVVTLSRTCVFTAFTCATVSGEPGVGGAAGRSSLAEAKT